LVPSDYTSESIEVLTGLEPVRKRPGMYTDTASPNHLVMEVIDNSVAEALAGHAKEISVNLHKDFSVTVEDDLDLLYPYTFLVFFERALNPLRPL
jgi:topoisomerase-4 subunit B